MSVLLLRWAGLTVLLMVGTALHRPAQAETIQGFPQNSGQAGLVAITVQGDPLIHSGILISPNVALTGKRWFSYSTVPNTVTVTHGRRQGQPGTTMTAADVWLHPQLPLALVRVGGTGFSGAPTFSFSNSVPAANTNLVCMGFSAGGDVKRAELRVQGTAANGYVVVSRARTDMILNDGSGMPCFTESGGFPSNTITGIAVSTSGADAQSWQHTQVGGPSFKDWIPNMIHLSTVRSQRLSRAFSLYTKPDPNNPNLKMCLDIPGSVSANTPVNQHACHYGPNQLFYFHQFNDSRNPVVRHYTIVHQNSGMCLDIPNGSTAGGVKVQQYPCNQGLNQDWEQFIYEPQPPGGLKFVQKRSNLCLSAPAPPNSTTNSLQVEQNGCLAANNNLHQRWFIRWK